MDKVNIGYSYFTDVLSRQELEQIIVDAVQCFYKNHPNTIVDKIEIVNNIQTVGKRKIISVGVHIDLNNKLANGS